jgi:hypothetical protein
MRDIYIIVHERCVDDDLRFYRNWQKERVARALSVKRAIEEVKAHNQYLEITGNPRQLHPRMPPPAADLQVRVLGAYLNDCVRKQKARLRDRGYAVKSYLPGCLRYADAKTRA